MVEKLKTYDIVAADYFSLDGTIKQGLFLVLCNRYGNVLCSKITSQFDSKFLDYSVIAYQRTNPFLECDSYIQLDKLHTLNEDACEKIGALAPAGRMYIKNTLNRFHYNLLKEINADIRCGYRSPNLR